MRCAWLVCVLALAACNPRPQGATQKTASPQRSERSTARAAPSLHIRGKGNAHHEIVNIEQDRNRTIYQVRAKTYESTIGLQGAGFKGRFSQARVTFFERDGTTLVAQAPTALIDKASERVTLRDGVRARTSAGIQLSCDTLTYQRSTGRIRGEGNVHISQPSAGYDVSGGTFQSDVELRDVRIGS